MRLANVLLVLVMPAHFAKADAGEISKTCSRDVSVLNDNAGFEAFEKQDGGKDRRLRFRLEGREPCSENQCKLDIVHTTPGSDKADNVIASIDLTHRDASYCVSSISRVQFDPDVVDAASPDCPASYLFNNFFIRLSDEADTIPIRWINVEFLYRAAGTGVSLDNCYTPGVLDGPFRRHLWIVPLGDGSAAYLGEADVLNNSTPRHATSYEDFKHPFVMKVFGAKLD